MNSFLTINDAMGRSTDIIAPSSSRHVLVLEANAPVVLPVPADARRVLMNATGPVWVQYGGPASIPIASNTSGSAPELNPVGRLVEGVTVLGFAAPAACSVSISFFG